MPQVLFGLNPRDLGFRQQWRIQFKTEISPEEAVRVLKGGYTTLCTPEQVPVLRVLARRFGLPGLPQVSDMEHAPIALLRPPTFLVVPDISHIRRQDPEEYTISDLKRARVTRFFVYTVETSSRQSKLRVRKQCA